ncbi:mechanosensitive ion channel family protein [Filimonas effusa]|uniref:Mechanosensitive ion channel n=1 Tax=Filimonas effusa TaxID=2508721 RepID=A0A4Q1D8J3_9BACT|nr:mechanosensitive ion channel domain-containing protein [Filimonas effusa]RXK85642.1 mechanosensitive ion channel [Filimonas effusa]
MLEQLERTLGDVPDFVWNLVLFGIAILIGFVVKVILAWILKLYSRKKDFTIVGSILKRLSGPVNSFLPLFVLNLFLPLMRLSKLAYTRLDKALEIFLIATFAAMLIAIVKVFEDNVYRHYDLTKADNLRERKVRTQLQFIRKLVVTIIVMLTVCAILLSFEGLRKIGAGLLTGVGLGGIIIGFAAQKSLGNLLAGFQIAFTQPIRIDDVLVVEGEWGRVEEITLTYVVLNIWDQRRLILPINYFIEKPFQNWTRSQSAILGTAFIYLDYMAPVAALRDELGRLLNANPLWDKRAMALQVTDIKERTMEIRMLMSASNSGNAFDLRCYVRENIVKFVKDNYPESLPKTRAIVDASESSTKILDIPAGK